ncbi:MAG: hypothetical protein ACXW1Z_21350, partial [Methylobacter sp.]
MTELNKISTTQLAKKRGIAQNELFAQLNSLGLIQKENDLWVLTEAGERLGGVYLSGKYGQYVAWPEDIEFQKVNSAATEKLITATALSSHFDLSANKMKYILSELGWIKKGLKGWLVTDQGKQLGGVQGEDTRSGIPYARWPESILHAKALKDSIDNIKGVDKPKTDSDKMDSFRHKFEATHRTTDGHFVRSKAEMLIENGELATNAIIKLTHRYLDGKPTKVGKRSLSVADRDLDFWMASFWNDISDEVFETEAFALALARYLQQSKVTRPGWLQHVAAKAPQAFRRAIRYSQVFLSPTGLRWKEIIGLDLDSAEGLPDFIKACAILQDEHHKLKNVVKSIEAELKRLTPMETLVYASLFAFKHVVYSHGQQELRPDLFDKDRADALNVDFQKTT